VRLLRLVPLANNIQLGLWSPMLKYTIRTHAQAQFLAYLELKSNKVYFVVKSLSSYTSFNRCCPQWTVPCNTGSVGCCDPARPWQRNLDDTSSSAVAAEAGTPSPAQESPSLVAATGSEANVTVVALFSSPQLANLDCVSIDAQSGIVQSFQPVTGPAASYFNSLYSSETRVYPHRSARNTFVFADIVQSGATADSPITLYTIDADTCASTALNVTGASGFVVSFAYHPESDTMMLTTGAKDATEFNFYSVDLDTAAATHVALVPRGETEASSPAYYAPYLSALDLNGTSALRLGYQEVSAGAGPGLGVTPLTAAAGAEATWEQVPTVPNQEALFYSLTRPKGGNSFVSLSPAVAAGHSLSVVAWARNSSSTSGGSAPVSSSSAPRVLLDLSNAHPPGGALEGVLGYVADVATADWYAALVVAQEPGTYGRRDTWALATVNLSNESTGYVKLNPGSTKFDPLGAEIVSVSGIGILVDM